MVRRISEGGREVNVSREPGHAHADTGRWVAHYTISQIPETAAAPPF